MRDFYIDNIYMNKITNRLDFYNILKPIEISDTSFPKTFTIEDLEDLMLYREGRIEEDINNINIYFNFTGNNTDVKEFYLRLKYGEDKKLLFQRDILSENVLKFYLNTINLPENPQNLENLEFVLFKI